MTDTPGTQHDIDPAFDVRPGEVPPLVIDELRSAFRIAADHAESYADAVTAQATKYQIKPGALKRYIRALEADKLDAATQEAGDFVILVERGREEWAGPGRARRALLLAAAMAETGDL